MCFRRQMTETGFFEIVAAVLRYCSKLAERNIGQHHNKDIEWRQELRKGLNKISILLAADKD